MRKTVKAILAFALTALVSGCATQRQMTRDEYLQTTQRTYHDKTPEDIFRAAERLFVLADGSDFTFHYTDDTMTASRRWAVYLVLAASMGTDMWFIRTWEEGGATKVSAMVSIQTGTIAPMSTTGGDWTATGLSTVGNIVQGTAIYDVFWARMDYLLGKGDTWMTCEMADARVKAGATWGSNDALCNSFNMKDHLPH